MLARVGLLFLLSSAFGMPQENEPPNASPEYLDKLLEEKRYEEFSYLMGLESPDLAKPNTEDPSIDPSFNEMLLEGDIALKPWQREQQRQGIRFDKYRGSRWPNERGQPSNVPYTISNQFSDDDRNRIIRGINNWNERAECVKFVQRGDQNDYINIFPGNGCYANLGRTGGQQSLSLGRGCFRHGTILHEMEHAIGIHHEHNRSDRDDFVEVLWNNIPQNWHSQYQKTNPEDFGLQSNYDYYSVMHYGMKAPGTNKDAFRIKKSGIDQRWIGQRFGFTRTDLEKIRILYCNSAS